MALGVRKMTKLCIITIKQDVHIIACEEVVFVGVELDGDARRCCRRSARQAGEVHKGR